MSKRFIERGLQKSQAASSDHAAGLANVGGERGGRRLGQEEFWTVVQPQVRVSQADGQASSPFTLGSCVSHQRGPARRRHRAQSGREQPTGSMASGERDRSRGPWLGCGSLMLLQLF